MRDVTNLLNALAGLAWPAIAFYAFYTLQNDLKKLIGRLRKGKILGQEIELDDQLEQLATMVESVKELAPITQADSSSAELVTRSERERILAEADKSALGAFLRVSNILEVTVNQMLARTGWHRGRQKLSIREGFKRLPQEWFGRDILHSVEQFSLLRSRIVHESLSVTEEEVRRAIEIGLGLLELVRSYPIEENRVKDLVDIYQDSEAQEPVVGVKGIRLDTKHSNMTSSVRIFPTTKLWYKPGQLVSWDWNMNTVLPVTYYRDPEDGLVKLAWQSSAEFEGYPLEEV